MKQILLSSKTEIKRFALVDDEDYDFLMQWKWHCNVNRAGLYVVRDTITDPITGKRENIKMHRLLMNPSEGMVVDHIDHDGLNNQRSNLRICTPTQNSKNRTGYGASKYLGVGYKKRKNRSDMWVMCISLNRKNLFSKGFSIDKWGSERAEIMAAEAYDKAAKEIHGEFASLNFK